METSGGAPLLGEPLPIELANTRYAVRGRARDGLESVEHLADWLRAVRERLAVPVSDADLRELGDDDLREARELRDAVRALADATVNGREAAPEAVTVINRQAARAPRWRELALDPQPHAAVRHAGPPVTAALAAVADEAITLFAGPGQNEAGPGQNTADPRQHAAGPGQHAAGPAHHELRACHGPGCVLHFVRDSPRREWCSPGCGNRARAARHYAKARRDP